MSTTDQPVAETVMPESSTITVANPPRRKRQFAFMFWQIVSAALALAFLISLGVGALRSHQAAKRLIALQATQRTEMKRRDAAHLAALRKSVEQRALSLARSMQMINPELLTEDGQKQAQAFFSEVIADADIAYIAVVDGEGAVTATTDLRLARESAARITVSKAEIRKHAAAGADFEAVGPITNFSGEVLGVVRVGMTYPKANVPTEKPVKKPVAKSSLTQQPAATVTPTPPPVVTPAPEPVIEEPQPDPVEEPQATFEDEVIPEDEEAEPEAEPAPTTRGSGKSLSI